MQHVLHQLIVDAAQHRRGHPGMRIPEQTRADSVGGEIDEASAIDVDDLAALGFAEVGRPLVGGKQLRSFAQQLRPAGDQRLGLEVQALANLPVRW